MKKLIALALGCVVLFSGCTPKEVERAKHCEAATVKIGVTVTINKHKGQVSGSGVAIGPHEILTARHLFMFGHKKIFVKTSDGKVYTATIENISLDYDLALLKVPGAKFEYVALASRDPRVGEKVYAVGWPLGLLLNYTEGIVTALKDGMIVHQAPIIFGNSGGGLFNSRGELVGINVAMITTLPTWAGIGVAEGLNHIYNFLESVN